MPAYKYEALDAAGRSQTGLVEADTPRTARAQLRERGLTPLSLNPVAAPSTKATPNISHWAGRSRGVGSWGPRQAVNAIDRYSVAKVVLSNTWRAC